jgi:hypothetical protein
MSKKDEEIGKLIDTLKKFEESIKKTTKYEEKKK